MDVRTIFLLRHSFYFFIADLLTLLLIGGQFNFLLRLL